jgi:DNA-directed RNA polymerase specialized sigma subunit
MDDKEQLMEWQKTKDPMIFATMVGRYQPVINSVVNKYRTTGLPPATLRAQATVQLIKAFDSYNPEKGTQPTTHIWNSLQKVQRMASESLMSGHVPEARNMKRATFTIVQDNLTDSLGREPNNAEMADDLGWNIREVERMQSEMKGETTASNAPFDFYGNSTKGESKDKVLVDYLYHELSGPQKVIFEHTFGYGGKPILNNKEISKKMNINEMQVHRIKKDMSKRVREMR